MSKRAFRNATQRTLPYYFSTESNSVVQRRRDDNKIKFALLMGSGPWGQRGKSSKNAGFHGKRHANQILKVQTLLSRNFVVIAQAPSSVLLLCSEFATHSDSLLKI